MSQAIADAELATTLDFTKGGGLVPVVTQDAATGTVLMLAYMDREALERTLATGEMHYHSRRRGLWHKGATSGNVQRVIALRADCDRDALLALVAPAGPACHTGETSCFAPLPPRASSPVYALDATIAARMTSPPSEGSYTQRLIGDRNLRLKKLGEETAELVVALADGDVARAKEEAADVVYHTLVALRAAGIAWADVEAVLAARAK